MENVKIFIRVFWGLILSVLGVVPIGTYHRKIALLEQKLIESERARILTQTQPEPLDDAVVANYLATTPADGIGIDLKVAILQFVENLENDDKKLESWFDFEPENEPLNDEQQLVSEDGLPWVEPIRGYDEEEFWCDEDGEEPIPHQIPHQRNFVLMAILIILLFAIGLGVVVIRETSASMPTSNLESSPAPTAMSPTATLQPTEIPQSSAEENRPQICDAIPNAQGCK